MRNIYSNEGLETASTFPIRIERGKVTIARRLPFILERGDGVFPIVLL
jgi:hypothetical protein